MSVLNTHCCAIKEFIKMLFSSPQTFHLELKQDLQRTNHCYSEQHYMPCKNHLFTFNVSTFFSTTNFSTFYWDIIWWSNTERHVIGRKTKKAFLFTHKNQKFCRKSCTATTAASLWGLSFTCTFRHRSFCPKFFGKQLKLSLIGWSLSVIPPIFGWIKVWTQQINIVQLNI